MRSEAVIRGRFAPSPSGTLHLGNLLSSLLAWLDVRSKGGVMLFRLEIWIRIAALSAMRIKWQKIWSGWVWTGMKAGVPDPINTVRELAHHAMKTRSQN